MTRRKKLQKRGAKQNETNVNQDRKEITDSSTIPLLWCEFVQANVTDENLDLSLRVQPEVSGFKKNIFKAFIHGIVTCHALSAKVHDLENKDSCSFCHEVSPKQQTSITLTVTATESLSDCNICHDHGSLAKGNKTENIDNVCEPSDKHQTETSRVTSVCRSETKHLTSNKRKGSALRSKTNKADVLDNDVASLPDEDVFSFEYSSKSREEFVIPPKDTKAHQSCNTLLKNSSGKPQLSFHCSEMPPDSEICAQALSAKPELRDHKCKKKEHNRLICTICGATFEMKAFLARHLKTHKHEKHSLSLQTHQKNSKPENKCDICNKTFVTRFYFKCHQALHTGTRPFTCSVCNAGCLTKSHLQRHMRIHAGSKSHTCEVCSKSFFDAKALVAHKYIHTGDKPFKCTVCEKTYTLRSSLKKHMLVHSDVKPFRCEICQKEFPTELQYQCHVKIHSDDRKFICELCGKRFLTVSALRSHDMTHQGVKRHKCDECGKHYRSSWYLQVHRKTHTGEDLIQCDSCGDWFTDPSYFKLHQKKFCKGKPEYCSICNRGFPNNRDLKSHMGIHTGERPFGCETCGKAFSKPEALSEHVKRHVLKDSYKCKVCGKGFINTHELKQHEVRHSRKKLKASLPDYMKPGHSGVAATDLNIQGTDVPLVSQTGVSSDCEANTVTSIVDEQVGCYLTGPLDIHSHSKEQTLGHETQDLRLFTTPEFKMRSMLDLTQPETEVDQSGLSYAQVLPPKHAHLQPGRDCHILIGDQMYYNIPQYPDIDCVSIQQQPL